MTTNKQTTRIAKKVFCLLSHTPQSVKEITEKIGCDTTTVNRYLKRFFNSGIAYRKPRYSGSAGRAEFLYFINSDASEILSDFQNVDFSFELDQRDNNHDKNRLLLDKIFEFINLIEEVEKTEQELRAILLPGRETDIFISRLKSGTVP